MGAGRSFHHSRYDAAFIAAHRGDRTISVCLPARECAATVGVVVARLLELREAGAIDEVVVIDAASADGTAEIAAAAGARVWQESELLPEFGAVRGKGDAMWRGLSVLEGDLVCFVDADTSNFGAHYATGLLGPLVEFPDEVAFVKGFYRRPLRPGDRDGGGRVNHLLARPALALFYPELAAIRQPLAGEVAASRALLERLPFTTGYGVEVAMLLDVAEEAGAERIVQVDLDEHRHEHQSLEALSRMAYSVLKLLAMRLEREGRLAELDSSPLLQNGSAFDAPLEERPPLAALA